MANGAAGGGWDEVGDLSGCTTREEVRALVDAAFPSESAGRRANWTGQLVGLQTVSPGDVIILPLKTGSRSLAFGICTAGYTYRPDLPLRHIVSVDWKRDDVPRSAIREDLIFTLGAIMTVFKATRNQAEQRFRSVIETGVDPGSKGPIRVPRSGPPNGGPVGGVMADRAEADMVTDPADGESIADPESVPTLETIRDRVRTYLSENIKGHTLTNLIADLLGTKGFVCDVSPPGADQGVDILAGSGPLGLDSPTLVVEVKSETGQISAPIVRGLQGAMLQNRADQGLLVAWGGITKDARREIRTDRLTMRVWDAETILDELFDAYDQLPEDTRSRIPLKRAWVLEEEAG